jgi:hypothetical protein
MYNKENKSIAQLFKEYCDKIDKATKRNKGSFLICSQELANVLNKATNEQTR